MVNLRLAVSALTACTLITGTLAMGSTAAGSVVSPTADVGCPSPSANFSSGNGTTVPYSIDDSADLQLLKTDPQYVDDSFIQTADIDMNGCIWDRGIYNPFTGTYDGGGFEISGLQVTSSLSQVGLIENLSGGTLRNVGFTGAVTSTYTSSTSRYAGGLVGYLAGGRVENSYATGNVTDSATSGERYVGGLVGFMSGGTIQDSYATGSVTSQTSESNSSGVGGLVGSASSGATISGSFASGVVTATDRSTAGGLLGSSQNITGLEVTISESYATGDVAATGALGSAGGLVGKLRLGVVERSYATGNVSGVADAQHLGGLFAAMTASSATDVFATGGVSGWTQSGTTYGQVGGLVGDTTGGFETFTRAYSATISGMSPSSGTDFDSVGGVAGVVDNTTWVSIAWNSETAPLVLNPIGGTSVVTGLASHTTSELNNIATFTDPTGLDWNTGGAQTITSGYDASYTWGICGAVNNGYPFLTSTYSVNPCASAPSAPTLNSVTGGNSSLTLTWTLGSDGGSPVTDVEYSTDDSLIWRSVDDSTLASDTIVVDSSGNPLVNGTTYQVRVRAVNSVGNGLVSNMLPGTPTDPTPPPVFPPSAPLTVTGAAGNAEAVISWDPPSSAGSFPITDYQAVLTPGGHTCLVQAPTLSCTITGLTNDTTYTAMVRALNGAGWGAWSVSSNEFTPVAPTPPVTKTIVITGTRAEVQGRSGVRAFGETTGLVGATVLARVHLSGEVDYYDGSRRRVAEDGSFTWQRRTNKRVYVFFRVVDDTAVRSNRIVIPIR